MAFDLSTWKERLTERLWQWRLGVEQAKPQALYTTLSAAALWPLVQAAQVDGVLPMAMVWGTSLPALEAT